MTNAVDVLAVGGPANGRMWCVNKAAGAMPSTVQVISQGVLTYPLTKWWCEVTQRWYWIARRDVDQVTDADIYWEVVLHNFQPAWDLRDLPAPDQENDNG